MEDSICKFMPVKSYTGNIKTVHFVYESEFHKLKQPFVHPIYYAHLVTGGQATLQILDRSYKLQKGTLFFTFPALPYKIVGSSDFKYMYISFTGSCTSPLMEHLEITPQNAVYDHFDHMIDLWMSSLIRVNRHNANLLSEGILLCTLSFINNQDDPPILKQDRENLFEMIVDYIENHYQEPDLSLKKIADIFSYTEKYLSHLFKSRMKVGFSQYLNSLRIQRAHELIERNITSVAQLAALCGFSDALYFSKVFKKCVGCAPSEYIKQQGQKYTAET